MNILISGSLAYDRIMDFEGKFEDHIIPEKIQALNVCFMVNSLSEKFGGTAGNIAFTLSLLEEKPIILSAAGKDFENYKNWLEKHDISLKGIKFTDQEFTAGAYMTSDTTGKQIIFFNPGAMKYSSDYDFKNIEPKETIAIISPGNLEDMLNYSAYYKKHGIRYIFDPGQQIPVLSEDNLLQMIEGSAILISNSYELEMIKEKTGLDGKNLLDKTNTIITTRGEQGSVISQKDGEQTILPAKISKALDPTGAGDAFRAGLIKGMIMKKDIVVCAKMGAVCGAYAVEFNGTQEHNFTWNEFCQRYSSSFDDELK